MVSAISNFGDDEKSKIASTHMEPGRIPDIGKQSMTPWLYPHPSISVIPNFPPLLLSQTINIFLWFEIVKQKLLNNPWFIFC